MTLPKDLYRAAHVLISQYGLEAEQHALGMMRQFMEKEDVAAASTWLMIAQTIQELGNELPQKVTVH